jgi:hypothetical protein
MADDEKGCKDPDCRDGDMIAVGPNLGGVCPIVRHRADHSVEPAFARIVPPGEAPSTPDALYLEHQRDNLFAVKPLSRGGSDGARKGPAKVTTQAFRDNYDNIFGKKATVGQA